MKWNWQLFVVGFFALMLGAIQPMARGQELTETEFLRLHKELQPAADEAWRTIPWKIALLDARRVAAAEHKPVFIWAMDGHPLGCT